MAALGQFRVSDGGGEGMEAWGQRGSRMPAAYAWSPAPATARTASGEFVGHDQ
jgi:hypothetical protein